MTGERAVGRHRTFWVSDAFDSMIESTRKKVGMSRSSFYKYCITKTLEQLQVLSSAVKESED